MKFENIVAWIVIGIAALFALSTLGFILQIGLDIIGIFVGVIFSLVGVFMSVVFSKAGIILGFIGLLIYISRNRESSRKRYYTYN